MKLSETMCAFQQTMANLNEKGVLIDGDKGKPLLTLRSLSRAINYNRDTLTKDLRIGLSIAYVYNLEKDSKEIVEKEIDR